MKLSTILLLVVVISAALLILKAVSAAATRSSGPWPFYIKLPLSQPEQVLYHRMICALPEYSRAPPQ